jgi:hypothetical protein
VWRQWFGLFGVPHTVSSEDLAHREIDGLEFRFTRRETRTLLDPPRVRDQFGRRLVTELEGHGRAALIFAEHQRASAGR